MPLLGNLIVAVVTLLINIFGKFMVLEKAFRVAAVVLMISLVTVMTAVMYSCANGVCAAGIAGISASHPAFAVGLGIAFNSTTLAAAGGYMAVWLACQLYVFQKRALNIIVK